jgi:transposase
MAAVRTSAPDPAALTFAVGIDIGATTCSVAVLHPDKTLLGKPSTFANAAPGFAVLATKLAALAVPPAHVLIGMEATGPYWESLYYHLLAAGYPLCVLHPAQTHQAAQQRGLRAKTDQLDAVTIARLLLSGDARPVAVPPEQILAVRELVRLRGRLVEDATATKLALESLLVVVFPEFGQVFADPGRATALALLSTYPTPAAVRAAGVATLTTFLQAQPGHRYGAGTAAQLVALAEGTIASQKAAAARGTALAVLADQLAHTQANIGRVDAEIATLLATDSGAASLGSVPEFGATTVATLRAELGDVERFARSDEVVAYVGLDPQVRQSGNWQGKRKLSKRGSGRVRKVLYMAALYSVRRKGSAFGGYYRHLVGQGGSAGSALMAVMRKMVTIAYRLLRDGGCYDATKVWRDPSRPTAPTQEAPLAA